MRKNVFGRQFKRDANERKALFKNLLTSLVLQERIMTTEEKAKAIKGAADKLVTKAKKGGPNAYRNLAPEVNHDAVIKLINVLAPRFAARPGGYTRLIKIGKRRVADNAEMTYIEWSETDLNLRPARGSKTKKKASVKKAGTKKIDKKEAKAKVSAKEDKKEKKAPVKKVAAKKK